MKLKYLFVGTLLFAVSFQISAQSKEEQALEKGKEALEMREKGDFSKSSQLLEEAAKLDNKNINFPYELAYVYYLSKEYKKAIKLLEGLKSHKDVYDKVYQVLGNAYESSGSREKSIDTYLKGLKLFPNSGHLYLEMGVLHLRENEADNAIIYFENGITHDPGFASNYYWASKVYCNSEDKLWGVLYGEVFVNLENNSVRTEEISKLLYDTYKSVISYSGEKNVFVDFKKDDTLEAKNTHKTDPKFEYDRQVIEPLLSSALLDTKSFSIDHISKAKSKMIEDYYNKGIDKNYPNVLIGYQKRLQEARSLDAYNHWIFMHGNQTEFNNWRSSHKAEYIEFLKWFNKNPLVVTADNKLFKGQFLANP
jgi:tetratricopeptide (TPR) repeat protein